MSFFIEYPGASSPAHRDLDALRESLRRHLLNLDDAAPDFLAMLLDSFLETTPSLLEKMIEHRNNQDTRGLHDIAHSLKSSSQVVGHMRLASYCKTLELTSRDAPYAEPMAGYVELILEEYRIARPVLMSLSEVFRAQAEGGL